MPETNEIPANHVEIPNGEKLSQVDSSFRLIIVAALRTKQLLHGSRPRIHADPLKRRNTSIALEEVRQGLVPFTVFKRDADGVRLVT